MTILKNSLQIVHIFNWTEKYKYNVVICKAIDLHTAQISPYQ